MKATLSQLQSYVKFPAIQALLLKSQCCGFCDAIFQSAIYAGVGKACSRQTKAFSHKENPLLAQQQKAY